MSYASVFPTLLNYVDSLRIIKSSHTPTLCLDSRYHFSLLLLSRPLHQSLFQYFLVRPIRSFKHETSRHYLLVTFTIRPFTVKSFCQNIYTLLTKFFYTLIFILLTYLLLILLVQFLGLIPLPPGSLPFTLYVIYPPSLLF